MVRHLGGVVVLLLVLAPLKAQDMPLSQILIEGEGWKGAFKLPALVNSVTHSRISYFTVPREHAVYCVSSKGHTQTVAQDIATPTCLVLWPDGGTLVVGDASSKYLWTFRVEPDGRLTAGERSYTLRVQPGQTASEVAGLAVDSAGRLYAATNLGVQVFDPTGRLCGVLLKPADGPLTGLAFGGENDETLYVTCGGQVYRRKLQARGVVGPMSPPQ